MDVPPFAATRPEGASDSRSEAEIGAAPATKASLCHGKSSAFSLPAVYSRAAEWLSRLCRSAGVLRMRILYGGRVRFCVCRPPKSKKRRFTLTSCVFCRVRAWMFRHSRQLAPKGHRTVARRRKLAQPEQEVPRVRKSCILRVPASVVSPPASVVSPPASVVSPPASIVDLPVSGFQAHQRPLPTIQRILPSAGA